MHAIIESGKVTNIIVWDGDASKWKPSRDQTTVAITSPGGVGIGYLYAGGAFAPPTPTTSVFAAVKDAEMKAFRNRRNEILNRLMGVGFYSKLPTVQANVKKVRQALLDLPADPALVAATDQPGFEAAMKVAYDAITITCLPEVLKAFQGGSA